MQGDSFKVAVISDDHLFLKELKNQLKKQFPSLNCLLTLQENARTTVQSLKRDLYDLIIAVEKNLDSPCEEFEQDIQRVSGSTAILVLGEKKKPGVSHMLTWPMVEWGTFIDRIFEMIPEEMKQKASLKRKDTALFDELQRYSQQFVEKQSEMSVRSQGETQMSALAFIPQVFESTPLDSSGTRSVQASEIRTHQAGNLYDSKNWVVFEICLILALFLMSAVCYRFLDNQWVFYIFLGVANLGLISLSLSRFFNPLVKKDK
jgi:hypothetical protein